MNTIHQIIWLLQVSLCFKFWSPKLEFWWSPWYFSTLRSKLWALSALFVYCIYKYMYVIYIQVWKGKGSFYILSVSCNNDILHSQAWKNYSEYGYILELWSEFICKINNKKCPNRKKTQMYISFMNIQWNIKISLENMLQILPKEKLILGHNSTLNTISGFLQKNYLMQRW